MIPFEWCRCWRSTPTSWIMIWKNPTIVTSKCFAILDLDCLPTMLWQYLFLKELEFVSSIDPCQQWLTSCSIKYTFFRLTTSNHYEAPWATSINKPNHYPLLPTIVDPINNHLSPIMNHCWSIMNNHQNPLWITISKHPSKQFTIHQ